MGNTVQLEYANMKKRNEKYKECHNLLIPLTEELKVVELESRVIGCNLRLRSLRIDVFGCHSRLASETRSSAMISRNDQGI